MRCDACELENPEGMKFCGGCGAPLGRRCSRCNAEIPDDFRFCGQCGAAQELAFESTAKTPRPEAERRQITVLFCDLVGSTALAERLDPEDLRELIRAYQSACDPVVRSWGGHVAQYLGDGLLVYFGYPVAHEDDARRAVHTGRGILQAIERLNDGLERERQLRLEVRVGIHTGAVVAGEIGLGQRREQLALGQTPNVAARIQGMAAPGTVLLSEATHRLVEPFFACRALGLQEVKGLSQQVAVFEVERESGVRNRFEVALFEGLSSMVGRRRELATLRDRFDQAVTGHGQVVLLIGEAGIGKSRLVYQLEQMVRGGSGRWLVAQSSSHYRNTAFYPVRGLLERIFGFTPDDSPGQRSAKIERYLAAAGIDTAALPMLAAQLALTADDLGTQHASGAEKRDLMTLLCAILLAEARRAPLTLVIEDLHWVDPSTIELFGLLIEPLAAQHVFLLLTSRPSFEPAWPSGENVTVLTLERLVEAQVTAMIRELARGLELPELVVRRIVAKADGVPLYVEELTKVVLEAATLETSSGKRLTEVLDGVIPETLQGSLMARLDRLGDVKALAQIGAVCGREVSFSMLQALSGLAERVLSRGLDRLVGAELLYRRGTTPLATYVFKHALIQEAAYVSLLKSTRQLYHRKIAELLVQTSPEIVQLQPELLAHHYTGAGLAAPAVELWLQAGMNARRLSANLEAVEHFRQGLALVERLPDTPRRRETELALWTSLGTALQTTLGYSASEVEAAYANAHELSEQLGDGPQLFRVLVGLWMFYVIRGGHDRALELARRLVRLAEASGQPALRVQARYSLGYTLSRLGELDEARAMIEASLADAETLGEQVVRSPMGDDLRVHALSHLGEMLWHLGDSEQAAELSARAVARARADGHPFGLVFALSLAAWVHQYRSETDAVETLVQEALAVAREHELLFWIPLGEHLLGWLMTMRALPGSEQARRGLEEMWRCLETYRRIGARTGQTVMLCVLAEAHLRLGEPHEGLRRLEEGCEHLGSALEPLWKNKVRRLHQELSLAVSEVVC